ncbi:MAG: VOC family protein [Pseudomonadota bacterium]
MATARAQVAEDIQLDRQRWTHMALRVGDLDKSLEWYKEFTHLEVFVRNEDDLGISAWMVDPKQPDPPFLLVMAQFFEGKDPFAGTEHGVLGPFAHFGIEMTSKEDVDEIAEKGKAAGCLALGPTMMPDPVGYICFLKDPDGNRVEYSYNQGVYETVREKWIDSQTLKTIS